MSGSGSEGMESTGMGYLECSECGADLSVRDALGVQDQELWGYPAKATPDGNGSFVVDVSRDDAQFLEIAKAGVPFCTKCGLVQDALAVRDEEY